MIIFWSLTTVYLFDYGDKGKKNEIGVKVTKHINPLKFKKMQLVKVDNFIIILFIL